MYYHIWIELKELDRNSNNKNEYKFDIDGDEKSEIISDIVIPYLKGEVFNFKGKTLENKDVSKLYITETNLRAKRLLIREEEKLKREKISVIIDYEDVCFSKDCNDVTDEFFKKAKKIIGTINETSKIEDRPDEIIGHLHKKIFEASYKKYQDGYYSDAVETAFKAINERLKKLYYKFKNEEKDGKDLFAHAFNKDSEKTLLKVGDLSTQSGKDEQEGYQFLLMGAWSAIRNPKAHAIVHLQKEDAYDKLILASMLMKKIDIAISYTFNEL